MLHRRGIDRFAWWISCIIMCEERGERRETLESYPPTIFRRDARDDVIWEDTIILSNDVRACLFVLSFKQSFSTAWRTSLSWKCVQSCGDNHVTPCRRKRVDNARVEMIDAVKTGETLHHVFRKSKCFEKSMISIFLFLIRIFIYKNENRMTRKIFTTYILFLLGNIFDIINN